MSFLATIKLQWLATPCEFDEQLNDELLDNLETKALEKLLTEYQLTFTKAYDLD